MHTAPVRARYTLHASRHTRYGPETADERGCTQRGLRPPPNYLSPSTPRARRNRVTNALTTWRSLRLCEGHKVLYNRQLSASRRNYLDKIPSCCELAVLIDSFQTQIYRRFTRILGEIRTELALAKAGERRNGTATDAAPGRNQSSIIDNQWRGPLAASGHGPQATKKGPSQPFFYCLPGTRPP